MRRIFLVTAIILAASLAGRSQVLINEICPANADVIYDTDFYNFSPWVELYNAGSSSVNISGYYLTDDPIQKTKWQIPANVYLAAKSYLLIWCDGNNTGYHTNFSLDSEGEELVLYTPSLQQVDRIIYPQQYTNLAYGRTVDGGTTWTHLVTPTPRVKNESLTATVPLDKPDFSLKAGRYSGSQTLSITHSNTTAEIYYTLDGAEPTTTATRYTTPIAITKTTTVKAKAFRADFLPSETDVKTYFINEHAFTLPVFSVSTKPAYLWNNTIGIYIEGTNGVAGKCNNTPVNWNQDWDRHAVLEYFEPSGDRKFDQAVDIRIGGNCTRNQPQKSLAIKARDKYGKNTIDEKLFDTKQSSQYGGFFLRNGGNDFNVTMFREALMQSLPIGQMDVDYLAYQPAVVYLNGQYWGIQNLREKIDADWIESNYGIKKDDLDLIETYGNAIEGSADAYNTYFNTLQSLNPTDPSTFQFIDQHIDVQEFINYLVAEIYYGNTDWPGNNIKFWRQRSTNGKFRWILWDLDFGFAMYDWSSYATHPTLNFATDPNSGVVWPNPPWSTLHLRLLLQNPEFKSRFIQTLTTAMSTTFKPERVTQFINDFQNRIKTEMPYHKQRWGGTMDDWNYEVQRLRDFAVQRNDFMKSHTASFFGLSDVVRFSASATPVGTGTCKLNGVVLSEALINGDYFKGLPFKAEPVPQPGYQFKQWKIVKRESVPINMIGQGDAWKYFDQGTAPAVNWTTIAFDDAAWGSGPAQLGYGDGDEQTVVSYGADANNKFITTYFRKEFNLTDISGIEDVRGSILFDDGVVVYCNGTEVYRNNMPAGTVSFSTLALQFTPNENSFTSFSIPVGLLQTGQNVIAVEVHQNSVQSSDIGFDFALKGVKIGSEIELTDQQHTITDIAYTDIVLEAQFEEVQPVNGIVINEFNAIKSQYVDEFAEDDDWIEVYNAGSTAVDMASFFITDDLSIKTKHNITLGSGKTVVGPGEYKILWADGQSGQGPLHLNFKLSASGEAIGLYQMVGSTLHTLDEVVYAEQYTETSYSRIPNATGPFMMTAHATPNNANIYEIVTAVEEFTGDDITVYPNPAEETIHIQATSEIDEVVIYNLLGVMVKRFSGQSQDITLSLSELPAGLYLITVRSGNHQITRRIIKK